MSVELTYELTGTGWADCRIRIDDVVATVTASYLSDALGDRASGIAALLREHPEARVSFWEEPGEYRWILEGRKPVFGFGFLSSRSCGAIGLMATAMQSSMRNVRGAI